MRKSKQARPARLAVVSRSSMQPSPAASTESTSAIMTGVRVLVLDHVDHERARTRAALESAGAIVRDVATVGDAVELIVSEAFIPDATILELVLDRAWGPQLVPYLNLPSIRCAFVVLTTHAGHADSNLVDRGAVKVLTKPIDDRSLVDAVRETAARTRTLRACVD